MIALGLLACDLGLRAEIVAEIARDVAFGDARLVAVEWRGRMALRLRRNVWGEIANQLGKACNSQNSGATAPKRHPKKTGSIFIGDDPTLIPLDELPPSFDYAVTRVVGNGNLAQVTTSPSPTSSQRH